MPRRGRGQRRSGPDTSRYRRLVNPFPPIEVLSADHVAEIHRAALGILADDGIRVLLPDARRRYEAGGCKVDESEQMVRMGPEIVEDALASVPATFDIVPRAEERRVTVGGASVVMMPVGGPPHVTDLEK